MADLLRPSVVPPEVQAFREYFHFLAKAITNPEELALKVYSKGFLTDQTRDDICLSSAESNKRTTILLVAVQRQLNSERMNTFTGVLSTLPPLQDLANRLRHRVKGRRKASNLT